MFIPPIVPNVETSTYEDILRFSYKLENTEKYPPLVFICYGNDVVFSNNFGNTLYVTPFRENLLKTLVSLGYNTSSELPIPFEEDEKIPEEYRWMKHIIENENWAVTHQRAYKISVEKGISAVDISTKDISISEVDGQGNIKPLCELWLNGESKNNIGTYIYAHEKQLIVCDEYGRSYMIRSNRINYDIVNALIAAGYKHTEHPEKYITNFFRLEK